MDGYIVHKAVYVLHNHSQHLFYVCWQKKPKKKVPSYVLYNYIDVIM